MKIAAWEFLLSIWFWSHSSSRQGLTGQQNKLTFQTKGRPLHKVWSALLKLWNYETMIVHVGRKQKVWFDLQPSINFLHPLILFRVWSYLSMQTATLIHTYGEFKVSSSPDLHISGLWEETGLLEGNPCKHGENMQTSHKKSPGPSCCEKTDIYSAVYPAFCFLVKDKSN